MSRVFANPLAELAEFEELNRDLNRAKGPVQVSGCMDSQKVHLMQEAGETLPWKLVVTYEETRAREIYDDFRCFGDRVWLYPAKDLLFYSADIHGNLMTRQRIQVFRHLVEDDGGVVITTVDGLMDHLLPLSVLTDHVLFAEQGQTLDVEEWKKKLVELGYERMAQVDGMGQFSIRGGIIDIFPLTEELPFRIELWDDEVDSIRSFDPESQRSVEQLTEAVIYPASELVFTCGQIEKGLEKIQQSADAYARSLQSQMKTEEAYRIRTAVRELKEGLEEGWSGMGLDSFLSFFVDRTVSFQQYFPEGKTAIFLDEPGRLKEKGETVETEFRESMIQRLEKGYLLPEQTSLLYSVRETLARLQTPSTLYLTGLEQKLTGMTAEKR